MQGQWSFTRVLFCFCCIQGGVVVFYCFHGMNLGMSIADGSCFVAHEYCLVDVVLYVGNVTISQQLSLPSISCIQQKFCFINCHPTPYHIILTIADLTCFVDWSKVFTAKKSWYLLYILLQKLGLQNNEKNVKLIAIHLQRCFFKKNYKKHVRTTRACLLSYISFVVYVVNKD
jgi:hypothetical protein